MNETLFFCIWGDNFGEIPQKISDQLGTVKKVILDLGPEFNFTNDDSLNNIINICESNGIQLVIVSNSFTYNERPIINNTTTTIIDYPAYWMWCTFYGNTIDPKIRQQNLDNNLDILDNNVNLNNGIDFLYITLNNLSKYHRCRTIDLLAKNDLFKPGAIAFRDYNFHLDKDRPELRTDENHNIPDSILTDTYKFEYWEKPTKLFLDGDKSSKDFTIFSQWSPPRQYGKSFVQIVTESDADKFFFFSEKTATPLLYNQLFLVVGCKNFHKNLVDMGFRLYHNIFDYSFDEMDNLDDRINGVISNLYRYRHDTKQQLEERKRQCLDILQHNRRVALSYIKNNVSKELADVANEVRGLNRQLHANFCTPEYIYDTLLHSIPNMSPK